MLGKLNQEIVRNKQSQINKQYQEYESRNQTRERESISKTENSLNYEMIYK